MHSEEARENVTYENRGVGIRRWTGLVSACRNHLHHSIMSAT